MERSGQGEVGVESRQDNSVEKQSKTFITDDEGIGGSENNSPRPGSSMGEWRPPASTEPPSASSPLTTEQRQESPPPAAHSAEASPNQAQQAEVCTGYPKPASVGVKGVADGEHAHGEQRQTKIADADETLADAKVDGVAKEQTGATERFQSDSMSARNEGAYDQQEAPEAVNDKVLSQEASSQFQEAVSALQDYQNKMAIHGSVPDANDEHNLKMTLQTMTSLCQRCCNSSASLRQQVQQARQLTDNISKDLAHKLQSDDFKDWIPPGYYNEEGPTSPAERQTAEKKRLARAAETKAALARASHELQTKAQELARTEVQLAEAELAAVEAEEVAEEAVHQLEAAKAAQEAKQQNKEKEEEQELETKTKSEENEENDVALQLEDSEQQKQHEISQQEEECVQQEQIQSDEVPSVGPQEEDTGLDDTKTRGDMSPAPEKEETDQQETKPAEDISPAYSQEDQVSEQIRLSQNYEDNRTVQSAQEEEQSKDNDEEDNQIVHSDHQEEQPKENGVEDNQIVHSDHQEEQPLGNGAEDDQIVLSVQEEEQSMENGVEDKKIVHSDHQEEQPLGNGAEDDQIVQSVQEEKQSMENGVEDIQIVHSENQEEQPMGNGAEDDQIVQSFQDEKQSMENGVEDNHIVQFDHQEGTVNGTQIATSQREDDMEEDRPGHTNPQEELQNEVDPKLKSQRVFEDVHVVHENQRPTIVTNEDVEDPASWRRTIYSLDPGDWDTGLGCIIRATSQSVGHTDLDVTPVPSASAALPLHDGEELISNIVCLAPYSGQQEAAQCQFSPFLSVSLPHCAPRLYPGKEPVVRMRPLNSGGWKDMPTNDVSFEDIKEHKFVEARVKELGTMCVVLRLKREHLQITRHGGKFMSSADSRVTLTWPPHCVKNAGNVTIGVQLLDQNVVTELRTCADMDFGHLMSCSPILHCQSKGVRLLQPLTVNLPCPPNPAVRPRRPATSVQRKPDKPTDSGGGDQRPATARPFFATAPKKTEEVLDDEVHVLWRNEGGTWGKLSDVNFQQSKKKDIVIFELTQPVSRIMLLRTRTELPQQVVERTASTLEHMLTHQTVHLLLRQHARNPSQVMLTYVTDITMERTLRKLAEEGYAQGPPPTNEIKLREGQVLELSFRGNIKPSEDCDFVARCAFHSNITFRVEFTLTEIDRFAQKGFDSYRGFVQVSTTYTAPIRRTNSSSGMMVPAGESQGSNNGSLACFFTGKHQLAELIVSLPKPDPETPRPLTTAPVSLKSYGPVTNDLLRHVAQQLAADDWRRLVPMLNIRRTRLQAILRQNVTTPAWLPIYDVLLTWSKRLPQSFDRTDMLCGALMAVGRNDLVEEVRDREHTFRKNRALTLRETLLNKAFIRIARHDKAVRQWQRLALFLGVSQQGVADIRARTSSMRERCLQSLRQWKEHQDNSGDDVATVTLLSHKLRLCRYRALARDIDSIR